MKTEQIQQIRKFNRYYTDLLGLLDSHLLDSPYSLAEARIFYEFFSNGSSRASDIVSRLRIDKGYLSRILKKFEKDGLILRETSEADGRVALLSLSPQGVKVFQKLDASSNQQITEITAHLDPEKQEELLTCMNRIMELLQR